MSRKYKSLELSESLHQNWPRIAPVSLSVWHLQASNLMSAIFIFQFISRSGDDIPIACDNSATTVAIQYLLFFDSLIVISHFFSWLHPCSFESVPVPHLTQNGLTQTKLNKCAYFKCQGCFLDAYGIPNLEPLCPNAIDGIIIGFDSIISLVDCFFTYQDNYIDR